jgi:hypothetical protein
MGERARGHWSEFSCNHAAWQYERRAKDPEGNWRDGYEPYVGGSSLGSKSTLNQDKGKGIENDSVGSSTSTSIGPEYTSRKYFWHNYQLAYLLRQAISRHHQAGEE